MRGEKLEHFVTTGMFYGKTQQRKPVRKDVGYTVLAKWLNVRRMKDALKYL